MTAHFRQKILKAHSNHAESYCSAEQWPSLGSCSMYLDILSPSLPLLAAGIFILALLHFHLSAQVSLVHVSAITDFFHSPRLLHLSFSLGSVWVLIAPKRRGNSVHHTQSQDVSLKIWEDTRVQEDQSAQQAWDGTGLTAVDVSKMRMIHCPLTSWEWPLYSAWKSLTTNTSQSCLLQKGQEFQKIE